MDASAVRVRDRFLITQGVQVAYTSSVRTASWAPPQEVTEAIIQSFWEPRVGSTSREAFLGIGRAIAKLLGLLKKAPRVIDALKEVLGLDQNASLVQLVKSGDLSKSLVELAEKGRKALKAAFQGLAETFPLSLFFVPHNKAPGITDLLARIFKKSPRIRALLEKIHGGVEKVDGLLKKYVPRFSRILYAAAFIWIWINVAELSWDVESILNGFLGRISLGELLASLPESGLGALAAMFGLGYGALPYALIARILWLVVNRYLEWVPGKGLRVRWHLMDVEAPDETVAL